MKAELGRTKKKVVVKLSQKIFILRENTTIRINIAGSRQNLKQWAY
jgi:hypothetical protein